MGKSSPSPPAPPDPAATAAAQAAANKEAAIASSELSMIDQYTPYGSLEYENIGTTGNGTPRYSATQSLSPSQQALYDLTNQASVRYGQLATNQLDNVFNRLEQPLTLGGQQGGSQGGSAQYGATRTYQQNVPAPEFVPPTAGEGVGGTRSVFDTQVTPASGSQSAIDQAQRELEQIQVERQSFQGQADYADQYNALGTQEQQAQARLDAARANFRPASSQDIETQQTYTDQGWIDTDSLPEGWQAAPTPEQIEAARTQWLLDNPPTTQDIAQTYTADGWVNTSDLPEGWSAPTGSTGPVGDTQGGSGYGDIPPPPTINEDTRTATRDSILERLDPLYERDLAALETRLANQGIGYGSDAWKSAMDDFSRSQNDARIAADLSAGDEMARMFGLQGAARDRAVNETVMQRNQPLNELAAMLTGSQVQSPSFVNTPQANIAPADIGGYTYGSYNGLLNNYNSAQQQNAANRQGLYGLLGAGAQAGAYAWSDRRLKRDIERIGELPNGLPVYSFRYNWADEWHIGLMADEVREVNPDAVVTTWTGYDAVNYAEAIR